MLGSVLLLTIAGLMLIRTLPGNADGLARWRLGHWLLVWSALSFGVATMIWLGPQTESAAVRISLTSIPIALLRRARMIDSVALIAQLTPGVIPYRSPTEFVVAPVVGVIPGRSGRTSPSWPPGTRSSSCWCSSRCWSSPKWTWPR